MKFYEHESHKIVLATQKKIRIFFASVLFALIVIIIRLIYLQIILMPQLRQQSENNFLRIHQTTAPRGNIVDASGILLATNRPLIDLYWQGTGGKLTDSQRALLTHVESLIDHTFSKNELFMQTLSNIHRKKKKMCLAQDLSFSELSKIKEQFSDHPNLCLTTRCKRFYPHNSYACHLLGYLKTVHSEATGTTGIEKLFDSSLKGEQGTLQTTVNSFGNILKSTHVREALAGKTITTTLNLSLQNIIESIFPENVSGSFIIMNPENGALISLVSRPSFDPSIFLQPLQPDQWHKLQQSQPFINRGLTACYPPGSIFKLISVSAALEHGIISQDSIWDCKGFSYFCKRKYWCHRRYGHGEITTKQALAQSCNILFFEIGKKIDVDILADYAQRFGLGKPTGIALPEKSGLIPTRKWKYSTKGESWWQGETLSVAIGQSFLLATPLQIARMISSIFTGYLVTPRILLEEPIEKTILDIQPETLDFLRRSMKLVVTKGTGKRINTIKNIEIYAKTSTAQTSTFNLRNQGNNYKEHGCFVAYFHYKHYQPLVIVILLEHVGSSRAATTLAKRFLIQYKKLLDENNTQI